MCTTKGQCAAGGSNRNGVYFLNSEVSAYRTIEQLKNGDPVSGKKKLDKCELREICVNH